MIIPLIQQLLKMEIIKIENKPEEVIEVYSGVIILDRSYGFKVEKRINNKANNGGISPYSVLSLFVTAQSENTEIDDSLQEVIRITIVNWCEKNGIGNPPADKK